MAKSKSYRILSIEAKDIYAAMTLVDQNGIGYDIRNKEGEINLKKFKNTLDYSIDTLKLEENYRKITRKRNFSFNYGGKKYTQIVINVTFSYSFKEFNQVGENTYVRKGYAFRDCVFTDGVYLKDGVLVALQTNVEIQTPIPSDMLPKYFMYLDGCYKLVDNIPVIKNKAELREELYENGFVCDGIKYVRYKRSSGSSRVGKCLFVNEVVAERMSKWDKCGLTIKENDDIDLAAWEAYISLPMSSIIDTIEIQPENILVVDDYESVFEDEVVAVETENDKLVSSQKKMTIKNSIWDGESLMDKSLFGEYQNKGMLLLRNRFFKTCAFNTNLQEWFKDNGITSVEQLNGFTLATDVSQIKLVTTPNSVKYLKFGTVKKWLEHIDPVFGIVKYEKEPHFFDGRMVQCHYQLLNTLQLNKEETEEVLTPSLNYIGAVRSDPDVLRYHIGFSFKSEEEEDCINPLKTKNDIIFKMLGINNKFSKTKMYKDFRDTIVKGFMRNLKRGHLLLQGNYSTLFGNSMEFLNHTIKKFNGNSSLPVGCIHSTRFEYGKTILGSRSPHITFGNILLVKNVEQEEIDKYFNLTPEIVCINAIGENIQQRLNGCDYDSDTMLLTDDPILIRAAEKNYDKFGVPTCFVDSKKTPRKYNNAHRSDLDVKTSVNKIGEIVNLSQQLNSLYWDKIHRGASIESNKELYEDICKLAVLSGIEIDKAKREYVINSSNEIRWLKEKYCIKEDGKQVKPIFFKLITTENGYELSDNVLYKPFNTTMDYLQQIVRSANFRQARKYKEDLIPFMDIVKKPEDTTKSGYYGTVRDKIIDMMQRVRVEIRQLYVGYELKDKYGKKIIQEQVAEHKRKYIDIVNKISEHEYLMYLVLKELDNKQYRDIHNITFEIVFGKPNESFMKMINESRENMKKIVETDKGNIGLYDFHYEKIDA